MIEPNCFPVKIEGNPITFQCRAVKLRQFRQLVNLLEVIKTGGMTQQATESMIEALTIAIAAWDRPEPLSDIDLFVDAREAMELIGKALMGMRPNEDEKKRSESQR